MARGDVELARRNARDLECAGPVGLGDAVERARRSRLDAHGRAGHGSSPAASTTVPRTVPPGRRRTAPTSVVLPAPTTAWAAASPYFGARAWIT